MKVRGLTCRQAVDGYFARDGQVYALEHDRVLVAAGSCCTHADCAGVEFEHKECPGTAKAGVRVPGVERMP